MDVLVEKTEKMNKPEGHVAEMTRSGNSFSIKGSCPWKGAAQPVITQPFPSPLCICRNYMHDPWVWTLRLKEGLFFLILHSPDTEDLKALRDQGVTRQKEPGNLTHYGGQELADLNSCMGQD